MKHLLFFLCFLLGSSFGLQAAESQHGIGFAAGQTSGLGISYRKMTDNFGFQVTFGALSLNRDDWNVDDYRMEGDAVYGKPYLEPFTQKHYMRETDANIGLLLYKVLHTAKRSRFYLFAGGSLFYNIDTFEEHTYEYRLQENDMYIMHELSGPKKSSESSSTIFAGFGIGIEFRLTNNIRIEVEWPLTYSTDGDFIMYIPQAGLHYFF